MAGRERGRGAGAGRGPASLGELLAGVLHGAGAAGGQPPLVRARNAWQQAVGAELAAQTRVSGWRNGVLRVQVRSAPLLQELATFRRQALQAALAQRLPGFRALQLRAGAWEEAPDGGG
ncbi:MAG: hypothetical protein KatS3mg102_1063 [Planctomycetota bacterium]|nr:MAG: hypothetical protein KatS3mg102_1063 [Planctomycetota bacterium]